MALRLVMGRSGSGKSSKCLEEMAQRLKEDKFSNIIFIVPEQFTLQAERDLIARCGQKGILSAQVLSFRRLAFHVLAQNGAGNRTVLDDVGKSMILRKVLFDHEDELSYYKKAVDKQGFMEQLAMTVTEFFQYNITEEKLKEMCGKCAGDTIVHKKLSDLSVIYQGYIRFISREYISGDDALDMMAERIPDTNFLEGACIWIDGFYGFTPQERRAIERLLFKAEEVTVTLTLDEKTCGEKNPAYWSGFYETFDTARKLKEMAAEQNCGIREVFLKEQRRYSNPSLAHLEREYFSYLPKGDKNGEGIRIFAASGLYGEVNEAARQITLLVEEKGYRYRDIAVVSRALEQYESDIKGIMQEYGIPYFIDAKRDIVTHPLIELMRSAVEVISRDFSYESVFRFLKTGLTPLSRQEIDILENYVLAYGIKSYKWRYEWNYGFSGGEKGEEKERINAIRGKVLSFFEPIQKKIKSGKKYEIKEIVLSLYEMLLTVKAEDTLSEWAENRMAENEYSKAYEHRQIWGIMNGVFERMMEILGSERTTIREFGKLLDAGFLQSDLGIIPPGLDQIIIGDIERTRLPEIKALFVLGVNEGILPSAALEQGLFTEEERAALVRESNVELAHSGNRRAFEEQFLIYSGLTKPSKRLFLSYSLGDLEGKTKKPSSLIGKLKKIFPSLEEENENCLSDMDFAVRPRPAMHLLGNRLRDYAQGEELSGVWKDVYLYFQSEVIWRDRAAMLRLGLSDTNQEGRLSPDTVQRLYGKNIQASVSRLERYASCPYSFFVQYGLRARERKLYRIDTPDLGLLFHSVLEKFSRDLEEDKLEWRELEKEQIDMRIEKAVDETAPEMGEEILFSTSSHQYLLKRLKRISKRAVDTLTWHVKKGTFRPYDFEIGFGKKEKLPPIVIDLDKGQKMVLDGKIDRVDILDSDGRRFVKIIDYKSGQKSFSLQEIYYGMQLQLLLYLEAFMETDSSNSCNITLPGGVFYFKVNDPMLSASGEMSGEEIERYLRKELRLSGLVLCDEEVLKGLDDSFVPMEGDGLEKVISEIIPVGVSAKGELRKDSMTADEKRFRFLMDFAQDKAREIGNEIAKGNITVSPYKNKQITPCTYCNYKAVCRFDPSLEENKFRVLKNMKKEELWERIERAEEEKE